LAPVRVLIVVKCLRPPERLARWRGVDYVEQMPEVFGELDRIRLKELERIIRLRVNVDPDDLEPGVGVSFPCASGATEKVQQNWTPISCCRNRGLYFLSQTQAASPFGLISDREKSFTCPQFGWPPSVTRAVIRQPSWNGSVKSGSTTSPTTSSLCDKWIHTSSPVLYCINSLLNGPGVHRHRI